MRTRNKSLLALASSGLAIAAMACIGATANAACTSYTPVWNGQIAGDLCSGPKSCGSGYRLDSSGCQLGWENFHSKNESNCTQIYDKSYQGTRKCVYTGPSYSTYYARVYFDANGGKNAPGTMSDSIYATSASGSHTFTIPSTKPTRDGYTFKGWDTNRAAATASIQPGATVTVSYGSSKTLYAVWQETPKDTTKPTITGVEDKTITVGDVFDPKAGVTANDDTDGDVTSRIKVTGNVDTSKPGTYELTYTVSDAAGNETNVKRTITVNPVMSASMPETGLGGGASLFADRG